MFCGALLIICSCSDFLLICVPNCIEFFHGPLISRGSLLKNTSSTILISYAPRGKILKWGARPLEVHTPVKKDIPEKTQTVVSISEETYFTGEGKIAGSRNF